MPYGVDYQLLSEVLRGEREDTRISTDSLHHENFEDDKILSISNNKIVFKTKNQIADPINYLEFHPFGLTEKLSGLPAYTPTVSACNSQWEEVDYWDFPLPSNAMVRSIFVNLNWAQKVTESGCAKVKWQIGNKLHANSPTYVDITEEIEEHMSTTFQDKTVNGPIHKITGVPELMPLCLRCMVLNREDTISADAKIKNDSYIRIVYET